MDVMKYLSFDNLGSWQKIIAQECSGEQEIITAIKSPTIINGCTFTQASDLALHSPCALYDFCTFKSIGFLNSEFSLSAFTQCKFSNCTFNNSTLTNCGFYESSITSCTFIESELNHSRFLRITFLDTVFENCDIYGMIFFNLSSYKEQVKFNICNVEEAYFNTLEPREYI